MTFKKRLNLEMMDYCLDEGLLSVSASFFADMHPAYTSFLVIPQAHW